jgi:DNA polymerase elongation subunit (family B)
MKKRIIFDIETGSLPDSEIERIAPKFDESSVKVGNFGIEKAIEKIHSAKAAHFNQIREKAALHAEYGQVLAIGIKFKAFAEADPPVGTTLEELEEMKMETLLGEEKIIIQTFWLYALESYNRGGEIWIGFNSNSFDLPFLLRRSMILGVKVPRQLTPMPRYWPGEFWIDLMDLWKAGDYRATISLDRFCKASGLEGKNGSGKWFAQLLEEDKEAAIKYLENDIEITAQLADKAMGVFS